MTYRWLASQSFPVPPESLDRQVVLYRGDLLETGRGEILQRA